MKIRNQLFVLLLILTLTSCEKHPFDYRNKYLGDYDVLANHSSWTMGGVTIYSSEQLTMTVNYWGDDGLELVDSSGDTLKCFIDKSGTMSQDPTDIHYYFSGAFTDKDNFELTYGYSGLGGSYSTTWIGQK